MDAWWLDSENARGVKHEQIRVQSSWNSKERWVIMEAIRPANGEL